MLARGKRRIQIYAAAIDRLAPIFLSSWLYTVYIFGLGLGPLPADHQI